LIKDLSFSSMLRIKDDEISVLGVICNRAHLFMQNLKRPERFSGVANPAEQQG